MSKGITIKPMGGLGNQLFQYAVGRRASLFHNVPLYADLGHFSESSLREYQLSSFSSQVSPRSIRAPEELRNKIVSLMDYFRSDAAHARDPLFFGIARERCHRPNDRYLRLPDRVTVRGYFQSWRYLEGQEDSLAEELRAITQPTGWYQAQSQYLKSLGPFIGVHVRLGDYRDDRNFGHLTDNYYEVALNRLRLQTEPVVLFSDEPSRAAALPFVKALNTKQVFIVENPSDSPPIETLNLMALSRDMVISNSTFGWWGAWLSRENNQGRVVAPTPWLLSTEFYEEELIPPAWITIQTRPGNPGGANLGSLV